jgi:hypothetical protein
MENEVVFDMDSNGFPLLIPAGSHRAPDVEELADIPVKSGNPHRQQRGRFGSGGPKSGPSGLQKPGAPTNGAPAQQAGDLGERHRREDAVRDAAREFETFKTQDLIDWLRGRITRPLGQAEVAAFEADVRAQQLADISDVLDQMVLGESRGRRRVKVRAPKGYLRKTIGALSDDELRQLGERLRARGWSEKQLKDGLVSRLSHERRDAVSSLVSPKVE